MKNLLIILIAFIFSLSAKSQEISTNNVFLEIGGATGFYSVNYERLLKKSDKLNFPLRIGLSYMPETDYYNHEYVAIPLSISVMTNLSKSNYLEIRILSLSPFFWKENVEISNGLGNPAPSEYEEKIKAGLLLAVGIGYRYQPKSKGLFFNALLQHGMHKNVYDEESVFFRFSIGLGFAFGKK